MNVETGSLAPSLAVDPDVRELIRDVLAEHECVGRLVDPSGSIATERGLYHQLHDLGLARMAAPLDRGGSSAGWVNTAELVTALGRRGCWMPIGESDLVADWLADRAGLPAADGLQTCLDLEASTGTGVPVHPLAGLVLLMSSAGAEGAVAQVARAGLDTVLASSSRMEHLRWHPVGHDVLRLAKLRMALIRGLQVVGAMQAALATTITHVKEREQFGRPVAAFQAIQHLVAEMAAETSLAAVAVDAAVLEMATNGDDVDRLTSAVAVARSTVGHAAGKVARGAHQAVGAIGTTDEHSLHRFTTAMLAWRSDGGDTRSWDRVVLDQALAGRPLSDLELGAEFRQTKTTGGSS
ncbi:acyl-CoA dehydrogenase family protein [Aeromicrobium sp. CTD01-1L150]|uniref:acyl-CoA dehydrogenase family protein n=1 Tax=Aeromicrobium sp. CTD01-1L150 TaxID=3341830 RepID=UPI0035C23CAE